MVITQISAAGGIAPRGGSVVYGLGDDNNIYKWNFTTKKWE